MCMNALSAYSTLFQKRVLDLTIDSCELPRGRWELNSQPLEEPVLFTTETSVWGWSSPRDCFLKHACSQGLGSPNPISEGRQETSQGEAEGALGD